MDPTDASGHTAAENMKAMRIISVAMLASVLGLLAIALLLRTSLGMGSKGGIDIAAYLATAWAILSLPVASVLRAARWPGATQGPDSTSYWPRRRAAHIISFALLEGAGFFCCIALLVSAPWWPLFGLLVPVGAMLFWFPRDGQTG